MCHTRCLPLGNTAVSSGILSIPAADTTASSRMRRKAIDHLHAMNAHIHTRQGREEFIFLLRIGVDMIPVTGRRSRGSQNTQKTLDGNHRIVFHETGEVLWGEARFGDEAKGASFPWHGTRILAGGVGSGGCGWRLFRVFVRSAPFGFAFVATATAVVVVSIVVVVVVGIFTVCMFAVAAVVAAISVGVMAAAGSFRDNGCTATATATAIVSAVRHRNGPPDFPIPMTRQPQLGRQTGRGEDDGAEEHGHGDCRSGGVAGGRMEVSKGGLEDVVIFVEVDGCGGCALGWFRVV
mmetsp:Transcript_29383/g.55776  ORF Transcript_29383/g.55776 Transcript_29383/m.55776 type:complete len:293 (+) Transcript_29383:866-1744(+)